MNILNIVTREQVQALADSGFASKQAVKHFDICKDLLSGCSPQELVTKYDMDERSIRRLKLKCKEC